MAILPFGGKEEQAQPYPYKPGEREFVAGVYEKFQKMYVLKNEALDILGGRTLQEFWDQSVMDYGLLAADAKDPNDPVEQYQSSISRDKSDVFIAALSSQLLSPDVTAQNAEQQVDRIVSRVGSSTLKWAFRNDGWPSESGQQKNARYIHKSVVEGSAFVLDAVTKEGLESELVPNEEIYFSTFWQPDIQKHPYVVRAKVNLLYDEAEQLFGDNPRWKYVLKGSWTANWYPEMPFLKDGFQGIEWDDRVQVLYVWKRATKSELEALKKAGKVAAKAKRACFYNVIINDVPLFPVDNVLPYRHGFYPINRLKFDEFAKPEFLFGNSLPNKIAEDKGWLDAWKTLIRYKAKLGVLKPMFVYGGPMEDEIFLPAKTTVMDDEDMRVEPVPGVSDGVSQSDVTMLQMAEGEIDRGTVSPAASGQASARKETARAATIQAAASERMMDRFSQQLSFFQCARALPVLTSLFQLLPKRTLKMVSFPDEQLADGRRGTMEVLFEAPGRLTEAQRMEKSFELRKRQASSKEPKESLMVDPAYLDDIILYVGADASSILQDTSLVRLQRFQQDLPTLLQLPELDRKEVISDYLRLNEYPERFMAKDGPGAAPMPPQGLPRGRPQGAPSPEDAAAQSLDMAVAGAKLPSQPA